jgi:secernin
MPRSYQEDQPMECHAVVALARATVDGQTLFGQTSSGIAGPSSPFCRTPGRGWAPDEKVHTQFLELPQARQTYAVVGCQPNGSWGYEHGINEQQVAVGCLTLPSKLKCDSPALLGTDLTRLTLERSRTALQAVDLLTSLVERYGQGGFPGCPAECAHDHAFLIVDPTEAYAVETAGHYWVYQEVQEVRAVSNARVIRQDWDRISQGLASYAIGRGWWSDDGRKLDFAGALGEDPAAQAPALRRWGRDTLLLMEQHGHIDTAFVRHVLSDQLEETPRVPGTRPAAEEGVKWDKNPLESARAACAAGFVVALTRDPARLPMTWCALGAACATVYYPVFLDGELPEPFTQVSQQPRAENFWRRVSRLSEQLERDPERRALVQDRFARLQGRFDQEAEEFNAEGAALKQQGALADLQRQATLFMQYNLERFEGVLAESLSARSLAAVGS